MKLKRIVRFTAGYDCIRFKCINGSKTCAPGEGGSHGVHGMNISFFVKGPKGAVQFVIYTGWLPQHAKKDSIGYLSIANWSNSDVMPADLGYHSKKPMYEDHSIATEKCEFCNDKPCYYGGSGLNASDAMYTLVNGGDEALWAFLEEYYQCVFHDAKYPSVVEYKMSLRKEAK